MRAYAAVLLLTVCLTSARAEFSFGLNVRYDLSNHLNTSDRFDPSLELEQDKYIDFYLSPYIGIRPTDVFEIRPLISYSMHGWSKYEEDSASTPSEISSTQHALGLGIGFAFHIIDGTVLGLALGPELGYQIWFKPRMESSDDYTVVEYDSYYQGTVSLSIPLLVDFHFNDHVGMRLGTDLIEVSYRTRAAEVDGSDTKDSDHDIDFGILTTIISPTLGLTFTF